MPIEAACAVLRFSVSGWVSLLVTELAIVMDSPSRTQAGRAREPGGYGKASSGPGRAAPGWYCGSAVLPLAMVSIGNPAPLE